MDILKRLREEREMSQKQLAEQVGTYQQTIYKYEHDISEPDIQMLIALADFFDVSIDYLVGYSSVRQKADMKKMLGLSKDETAFLEAYKKLNPKARRNIMDIMDTLVENKSKK
ncbi:MAG: helix-turn-helix domain-containing protein [Oscillospiraceae bacterium]|nr:helix-turn-helix domain-containing protein [Oscillospiraceae bacterium]